MGDYIKWDDVTARYPSSGRAEPSGKMETTHILPAEAKIEGLLAPGFAVPFSAAHPIVKDLCIMEVRRRMVIGKSKEGEDKALAEEIADTVKRLVGSEEAIITADGDALWATSAATGGEVFSTTKDFNPVFDMRSPVEQRVDPDRHDDEEDRDDEVER